jgi:hypothetical protein
MSLHWANKDSPRSSHIYASLTASYLGIILISSSVTRNEIYWSQMARKPRWITHSFFKLHVVIPGCTYIQARENVVATSEDPSREDPREDPNRFTYVYSMLILFSPSECTVAVQKKNISGNRPGSKFPRRLHILSRSKRKCAKSVIIWITLQNKWAPSWVAVKLRNQWTGGRSN